jgi:hypothetical protein
MRAMGLPQKHFVLERYEHEFLLVVLIQLVLDLIGRLDRAVINEQLFFAIVRLL